VAFWVFWALMVACFCVGFIPKRHKASAESAEPVPEPTPDPAVGMERAEGAE
jgi:hypothetical protein